MVPMLEAWAVVSVLQVRSLIYSTMETTVHASSIGTISGTVQEMFTYRRMDKLTTETTGNVCDIARTGHVRQ